MKNTKSELKIPYNVRAFAMNSTGDEAVDQARIEMIRSYIRTKDLLQKKKLFDNLIREKIINREYVINNLVVEVGRTVIARRLTGDNTYSGEINYGALGDGTPSPAEGSTVLDNEVFRKVKASAAFGDDVAYVDFFYTADDVDGTFTEFANFIDGTGTPDSGQMWSYIATGGWVKSNLESLFVSCEYTISNA